MDISQNATKEKYPLGIDVKLVKGESRRFSSYPNIMMVLQNPNISKNSIWLELSHYVVEDLQWLLSLEHHLFWSYMIYSEHAQKFVFSILEEFPPNYIRNSKLVDSAIKERLNEVEYLLMLVFTRLTTNEESDDFFVEKLSILCHDTLLLSVPVILDICSFYASNNAELVKVIINQALKFTPDFKRNFQGVVVEFYKILKSFKGQFLANDLPKLVDMKELPCKEIKRLLLLLHDATATVQLFLDVHPSGCQLFSSGELVNEITAFYSNLLPELVEALEKIVPQDGFLTSFLIDLIEFVRIDLLKIVKSLFDFILVKPTIIANKETDTINEYLDLMIELLAESTFLGDYNHLFPVAQQIESLTKTCSSVDTIKVKHILLGVSLLGSEHGQLNQRKANDVAINYESHPSYVDQAHLIARVSRVKDVLPHLSDAFIRNRLICHNYDTERVIAAALENDGVSHTSERFIKGNFNLNNPKSYLYGQTPSRCLDTVEKEKYARWHMVPDQMYDDEYDDTYDDNVEVVVGDGDNAEKDSHSVVLPRLLDQAQRHEHRVRATENEDNQMAQYDESILEHGNAPFSPNRNPSGNSARNGMERTEGRAQVGALQRNRTFKETHKSFVGNHNRKIQARKKRAQGLVPT